MTLLGKSLDLLHTFCHQSGHFNKMKFDKINECDSGENDTDECINTVRKCLQMYFCNNKSGCAGKILA